MHCKTLVFNGYNKSCLKDLRALAALIDKKERDYFKFQGWVRLRFFLARALRVGQAKGSSAAVTKGTLYVLYFNAACM